MGQQTPDLDVSKKYVFVDEAGFHLHIQRNRGRSEKWQLAKGITPAGKGVSFALLGAISQDGIIDITMRKLQAASGSKMRKIEGKVKKKVALEQEQIIIYIIFRM